ncbi:hypothetical protein RFF05_01770 [Bengtsoniella intestinalis]|uniref:hypothetical protein n=1 Tax=Bengtsoniella intestinalis TaxID=3073143 RepID=UPI00391FC7B1
MEEILEQDLLEQEETTPADVPVELSEELPEEEIAPEMQDEPTAQAKLEGVATALALYGGSGNIDTVETELIGVMEGLLEAHVLEVEQSRKAGMLTFALTNLVHDTGAVLAMIDMAEVDFDPYDTGKLRDFLEPIYQEKPYLFKVLNPLRGANVAMGIAGKAVPTNRELGALTMEEYTAYRTAQGSVSR